MLKIKTRNLYRFYSVFTINFLLISLTLSLYRSLPIALSLSLSLSISISLIALCGHGY